LRKKHLDNLGGYEMSTTNQTARVLELLKRFNNGNIINIDDLLRDPLWEEKSIKTVRRDLKVISEYFPDTFESVKGQTKCYKAITNDMFNNFLKPEIVSLFVQTFSIAQRSQLFNNFNISDTDRRLMESKIKDISELYEIKNRPYEINKDNSILFTKIEKAIKYRKYTIVHYNIKDYIEKIEVKPYKILFMNENFYLAAETNHKKNKLSLYRISNIKSIEDTSKTFQRNPDISDFINSMQTPFAKYRENFRKYLIEVILEVNKQKANFFKNKKQLSSQNIIETKDNGNILVSYKVTQFREIDEIIKKWLPYVRVISPIELKNKIDKELKDYLDLN
jgi:predicted DNA-binding transcriptional regulator YafY